MVSMLSSKESQQRCQVGVLLRDFYDRLRCRPVIAFGISYPKSGRTWLEVMVSKVYSELTGVPVLDILKNREIWMEYRRSGCSKLLPRVHFSHGEDRVRICQGLAFPLQYYRRHRVFLTVRDPRDVVVSHYYHEKFHYNRFEGSIGEFVRSRSEDYDEKDPRGMHGVMACVRFMNAWARHRSKFRSFLPLFFEDMRRSPEDTLRSVFRFIRLHVPDDVIATAVQFGSLENMKLLEDDPAFDWYGLELSSDKRGRKVRTGIIGGYNSELAPNDIEYINKVIISTLDPYWGRYL